MAERDDSIQARAGLTLAAAKAALQKWQGHMRRASQLQNEEEFAAALALVPYLPQPAAYQARTLRAFADFCAAQGRLDEACALFGRVGDDAAAQGRLSPQFWRDYAALLFRLALRRVAAGQVALANDALNHAAGLLAGPADQPEAWAAAWDGYAETALWFERAGEAVPAGLYAERALGFALRLGRHEAAAAWLRKMAQTGLARAGVARALPWLERLQALRSGWPAALGVAVQAALGLAHSELALGRPGGAEEIFQAAQAWLQAAGGDSPALADLHLGWGLALGPQAGREHLELALSLRRRLLGPGHPRTREAEQALGGLEAGPAVDAEAPAEGGGGEARSWDGGAQFQTPASGSGSPAAEELKRLQRRLVRLCHPDAAISDSDRDWRHEMMVRVNHAVDVGDLFSLRALLREAVARGGAATQAPFTQDL